MSENKRASILKQEESINNSPPEPQGYERTESGEWQPTTPEGYYRTVNGDLMPIQEQDNGIGY